jgi:small subunit ribosomal protein S20
VANIKSQIKRNLQNERAHERNKAVRSALKTAVRKFREAVVAGNSADAKTLAADAGRALDKAASKGVNRKSSIQKQAASL